MVSDTIKKVVPLLKARGYSTVLDYGAGTFRNSRYLKSKGFSVVAVERPAVIKKFAKSYGSNHNDIVSVVTDCSFKDWKLQFDVVVCTFVLNILDWDSVLDLADDFTRKTVTGGLILIEAKEKRRKEITNALTLSQLDRLFLNKSFCRLYYYRGRYSIRVIYERL